MNVVLAYSPPRRVAPFLVAAVAALGTALPRPARAQTSPDPMAVLERASAHYARAHALCADFVQTVDNPMLHQTTNSHGELCQRQPDLFSMRFAEPDGDLVVADGTYLWVYYPSMEPKQVFRSDLDKSGQSFDFHKEFLDNPRDKYTGTYVGRETLDGAAVDHVKLIPKADMAYESAELWIGVKDPTVRKLVVHEKSGMTRTVVLSHVRFDPPIAAGTFAFTPPPGVRVIAR